MRSLLLAHPGGVGTIQRDDRGSESSCRWLGILRMRGFHRGHAQAFFPFIFQLKE